MEAGSAAPQPNPHASLPGLAGRILNAIDQSARRLRGASPDKEHLDQLIRSTLASLSLFGLIEVNAGPPESPPLRWGHPLPELPIPLDAGIDMDREEALRRAWSQMQPEYLPDFREILLAPLPAAIPDPLPAYFVPFWVREDRRGWLILAGPGLTPADLLAAAFLGHFFGAHLAALEPASKDRSPENDRPESPSSPSPARPGVVNKDNLAQTLQEVGALLTAQLSLEEVLEKLMDLMSHAVAYDSISIQLLDHEGRLNLAAGRGFKDIGQARQAVHQLSEHMLQTHWEKNVAKVIPDTQSHPNWNAVPFAGYIRSWAGAPLLVKGRFIGSLNLDSCIPNAYDEHTAEAVMAFANQAAVAIENARLFEAERTARLRAEALSEAVMAIGSSLSLNQVLYTVLKQLARVLPFDSGAVMLLEGNRLVLPAWRGYHALPDPSQLGKLSFDLDHYSNLRTVIQEKRPLVISDTSETPHWLPTLISSHIRSWLGVPLFGRDGVIGLFSLDRTIEGGFSEDEVALAQTFSMQAAAAIENARLYETEEQRAAQLETLHQVSLSLTSSLDLKNVLDSILSSTFKLLPGADNTHIFLYDSDKDKLTFQVALWSGNLQQRPWSEPRPDGLTYTVARRGEMIAVPDMSVHPLFAAATPDWRGAIIGLPLKIGNRIVGVMNVSYKEPNEFPTEELRILRLLGDQAAIAIENARLFTQAATERRHLSLLYDLGRTLAASMDPDEILQRAVSLTTEALQGIIGQIFLHQPDTGRLVLMVHYGRPADEVPIVDSQLNLSLGQGLAGWAALHRQAVIVPDVKQDPRWLSVNEVDQQASAAITAPILFEKRLLGVITILHPRPGVFTEDHLALLQAISHELALGLSNAQRYQQVERRLAEITLIQNLTQAFAQRLDLQVLLDEVVTQLSERLGYPQVEIYLHNRGVLSLRAFRGHAPAVQEQSIHQGLLGRVVRTGEAALIPDSRRSQEDGTCDDQTVAELAVPIFRSGEVIGVIDIQSGQAGSLGKQDLDLLQVLAGQISIAFENALLYEQVRQHAEDLEETVARRTSELMELYQLSQEIGYQLSYEALLRLLLRHLHSAVQSDTVAGWLDSGDFHGLLVITSRPITEQGKGLILEQWLQLKEGSGLEPGPLAVIEAEDFQPTNPPLVEIQSLLFSPIYIEETLRGGLLVFMDQGAGIGAEQERLVTTFANQAATAVQRLASVLSAQQKHLESLFEHVPMGVLLLDTDFNLLSSNPLGRENLAVLNEGETSTRLTHLGPLPISELIRRQEEKVPVEIALPQSPRRTFSAQIRQIGEENQEWVLTLHETTEERENQLRIQSQERLATVGQLAAGIAHDFNNIMAAILVYADLLYQDPHIPESSREKLAIIRQQVNRASSLIRQILDFSRRSVMEQSALDLLPFIKELDKLLGRILPETIRLELTYQPGEYWVHADPTRLQQVFMNLALNSRDAMPAGGLIKFTFSKIETRPGENPPLPEMNAGEWICVSVSDTGTGIPPEIQPHIFDPFFTTKPVGQGTGLGLSQVYGIIKQHGGFLDVQSEVGKGARFDLYLPALPKNESAGRSPEPGAQALGQGELVLVVEDNNDTRQALQTLLEALQYRVLTAANGQEALEVYERHQSEIVLVVSDLVMPRMGGIALLHALQERWPGVKMLLITGHPMEPEDQTVLEVGAVNWLQKPFTMKSFTQAIQGLLQQG